MRKTIKILLVLSAVSLLAVVGIVWAYEQAWIRTPIHSL